MNTAIPKLLRRLWQSKAEVKSNGFVTYQPGAERTRQELLEAYRQVRNLLVVRLDAIGDTFLWLDGLRKLRRLFPEAHLAVVAYAETKPIYQRCPEVNQVHYVEREGLATNKFYREGWLKTLQGCPQSWDLVLNPLYSREFLAEELVLAAPAEVKIGVGGDHSNLNRELMQMTNGWYTLLLPVDTALVRHELHRNNEILSLLGSTEAELHGEVPLTAEDRQFVSRLLGHYQLENYGVVFPGTKGGAASIKYWGSENYAAVMEHLKGERGLEVIMMLGGRGEESLLSEISALTRFPPHIFPGDLSLWQAAAVLEKARFYIGSDTSMAHIAAALKVPTLVLLGGGHYGRFFPYPEGSSVHCLAKPMACYNCCWKCTQQYNKCIADIGTGEVIAALASHLPASAAEGTVPAPALGPAIHPVNITRQRGSQPRVDVVFSHGLHSWHLQEALPFTLQKMGCLGRVFRPTPQTAPSLLKYLQSGGEADMLLAMGGDHHLWYLHDSEEKREAWHQFRGPRVCNSFESNRDSLYKKYIPRLKTGLHTFTHFAYSDEVDEKIFAHAGRPAIWWPQAADSRMFFSHTPFLERTPRVFFCGKVWNEYPLRRAILDGLHQAKLAATTSGISTGELVQHYNQYMFAINLPGVLGGFNVRTFEALSCGSLLLQFLPAHRPANNALFQHQQHLLYYDYSNLSQQTALVRDAIKNPEATVAIARRGHEEVRRHHTLENRLSQLMAWVLEKKAPVYPQYHLDPAAVQQSRDHRYVNDRYLFEGRPLTNVDAANEFADLDFLAYHAMIPRLCCGGEQLAREGREVEALHAFQQAVEMDSDLEQAHNNLGVLFWQRGDRHRALAHFEAALAESPHYRPGVVNLGEALTCLGKPGQAHALYEGYLRAATEDRGIRTLLEGAL